MRFHRYVPTLAREILDNAPEINMQGLAVGDPCTDNKVVCLALAQKRIRPKF